MACQLLLIHARFAFQPSQSPEPDQVFFAFSYFTHIPVLVSLYTWDMCLRQTSGKPYFVSLLRRQVTTNSRFRPTKSLVRVNQIVQSEPALEVIQFFPLLSS